MVAIVVRSTVNTAPADNTVIQAGDSVTLTADAGDPDGLITKVEFYRGTTLLGTATNAPFAYAWSNVAAGSYTVTAQTTDDKGAVTASAPINISVAAPADMPHGIFYIHPDHLGTPRVVTDESDRIVWQYDLLGEPFGNAAPDEDPDGDGRKFVFNLRFPGQYYDKETGLNYNYHRDYDPATGRYIESDPIGLKGGINTYGYVGGNPVGARDPSGLETTIVINNNAPVIGTHVGVVVGSGAGAVLYDPGGSYRNSEKGSGDVLYGKTVDVNAYILYQQKDGADVQIYRYPTTPAEEAKIKARIEGGGYNTPGSCAVDTSNAIKGIGPFKGLGTAITPSGLGRALNGS